jgi:hypothetical protein
MPASHFAGVVQAVPDEPDTEIILESTANGVGGEFHERWQQAEAGVGDYAARSSFRGSGKTVTPAMLRDFSPTTRKRNTLGFTG